MAFGKTFHTRKEAKAEVKRIISKGLIGTPSDLGIRKLSKKAFPRAKKRFHVGSWMDWLNWG